MNACRQNNSGFLSEVHDISEEGRIQNLFLLESLIEIVKVRKDYIFVALRDMEKAYNKVNRKKLFEVMRGYGVHTNIIGLIYRI